MEHSLLACKQLFVAVVIALLAFLTSGCSTTGHYYDQPVTYVPQTPCYAPTYSYQSYPVYQPVMVPIAAPGNTWNASCTQPPPCHRESYYRQECSWRERRTTDVHREDYRAAVWGQRKQYAERPLADRNTPPRSAQQPAQSSPQPAPGYIAHQQFSPVNNQIQSER